MSKKDDYCATMESEIKKWDGEVDKLNAKGKQVSADLRVGYDTQLKAMRADRDLAYSKLQEMRTANESAWQHMQAGMDAAMELDEERAGQGCIAIQVVASWQSNCEESHSFGLPVPARQTRRGAGEPDEGSAYRRDFNQCQSIERCVHARERLGVPRTSRSRR